MRSSLSRTHGGETGEHPDHIGHQIGGWPVLQQGPIWRECDLVSQGYPLGTSSSGEKPSGPTFGTPKLIWQLLLQVESDDAAGWMWGDVGALYYTVRSSEPARAQVRPWLAHPPVRLDRGRSTTHQT